MGKPHPMELRQRVVAHVEAGNTHHSAAVRFDGIRPVIPHFERFLLSRPMA